MPKAQRVWHVVNHALPALLAVVPLVVVLVQQLGNLGDTGVPWADWAVLELATRAVPAGGTLTGPYSRFGFRHPGPAMFFWMAPFYWLSGARFTGLTIGTLLFHMVCLGGVVLVVQRVFGRAAGWVAAVVVLAFAGLFGIERFRDPWNPYWVVSSLALLLVCVVAAWALPRRWPLALAVAAGTVAVQSHLGVGLTVVIAVAAAAVGVVHVHRRAGSPSWPRQFAPAALTGVVLWIPPVVDQLIHRPGNLRALFSHLRRETGTHSLDDIAPAVVTGLSGTDSPLGRAFGPDSAYYPPLDPGPGATSVVVATAILLLVGAVVVLRRRLGVAWAVLGLLPVGATLLQIGASLRIRGAAVPYLFTAILGIALVWWLALVLYAGRWLVDRAPSLRERAAELWVRRAAPLTVATVAVVVLAVSSSQLDASSTPFGRRFMGEPVARMLAATESYCDSERPLWIEGTWIVSIALGVGLERCGADVAFPEELEFMVGPRYARSEPPAGAVRLSVVDSESAATASPTVDRVVDAQGYALLIDPPPST